MRGWIRCGSWVVPVFVVAMSSCGGDDKEGADGSTTGGASGATGAGGSTTSGATGSTGATTTGSGGTAGSTASSGGTAGSTASSTGSGGMGGVDETGGMNGAGGSAETGGQGGSLGGGEGGKSGAGGEGGTVVEMGGMGGEDGEPTGSAGMGGQGGAPVSASCQNESFTVTSQGTSNYLIDGDPDPALTLCRGFTYTFNLNASGHPFWIKTVAGTGTGNAFNTGVTGNGTAVGTVTFQVPGAAPNQLFYSCQIHAPMTGPIDIVDP